MRERTAAGASRARRGAPRRRRSWARAVGLAAALAVLPGAAGAAADDAPLADAAERRDQRAVRALLAESAAVDARQPDGATALHWAAHWNDVDNRPPADRGRGRRERGERSRRDAAGAGGPQRRRRDRRRAAACGCRSRRGAPGRRDRADDRGPHRQCGSRAVPAGGRRPRARHRPLQGPDPADVGGVGRARRRRAGADRGGARTCTRGPCTAPPPCCSRPAAATSRRRGCCWTAAPT